MGIPICIRAEGTPIAETWQGKNGVPNPSKAVMMAVSGGWVWNLGLPSDPHGGINDRNDCVRTRRVGVRMPLRWSLLSTPSCFAPETLRIPIAETIEEEISEAAARQHSLVFSGLFSDMSAIRPGLQSVG